MRGLTVFVLFFAVLSLFMAFGERCRWVDGVFIGLVVADMFVSSVARLWRVVRYGDFGTGGDTFWPPWQARINRLLGGSVVPDDAVGPEHP